MTRVTMFKDKCGFIHIYKGFFMEIPDTDADLFFQSEADIASIEMELNVSQVETLNHGYTLLTKINSDYFNN